MEEKEIRMPYSEFVELNKYKDELEKYKESKIVIEHFYRKGCLWNLSHKKDYVISDKEIAETIEEFKSNADERGDEWFGIAELRRVELDNLNRTISAISSAVKSIEGCWVLNIRRKYKLKRKLRKQLKELL